MPRDKKHGWYYNRKDRDDPTLSQAVITRGQGPAGPRLADAATSAMFRAYASFGQDLQETKLDAFVSTAVADGCRDPEVSEMLA